MCEMEILKEKFACNYYNHTGMCIIMFKHIKISYRGSESFRFVGCEHVSYILRIELLQPT
jgi:hypothetical protein